MLADQINIQLNNRRIGNLDQNSDRAGSLKFRSHPEFWLKKWRVILFYYSTSPVGEAEFIGILSEFRSEFRSEFWSEFRPEIWEILAATVSKTTIVIHKTAKATIAEDAIFLLDLVNSQLGTLRFQIHVPRIWINLQETLINLN